MSVNYVEASFEPMMIGGGSNIDVNFNNYILTESPLRYHAGPLILQER
ncbi:cysteine desulfurase [Cellulosilyticum sp. I15G10I2]|nr:cysteine desulfurase [Cellulosilyticum sp. I15G10I2]